MTAFAGKRYSSALIRMEYEKRNDKQNKQPKRDALQFTYARECVCVSIYMYNINILSGVKRIGKTSSLMGGEYNRDQEEMGAKRQNMAMVERYDADDRNNTRGV